MIRQFSRKGFTLIELMLAMSFVGILLVAIAMTSMQIMSIYNKGITIREVNQVGRAISEDMQRTIAASTPFEVAPKTGDESDPDDSRYVVQEGGGRLCTGAITYAWNYGNTKELSGDEGRPSVYNTYQGGGDVIRLVRVNDPGGLLCIDMTEQIPREHATELLLEGDRNLAIQKLSVSAESAGRDDASGQALYAIDLVLGTNDQEQINASTITCLPPDEGSGSEEFCAINQFSIIARAGNRAGSL